MNSRKFTKNSRMNRRKLLAFQLKYEGKKSSDIAKGTGYTEQTIAVYLKPTGKWYPEYLKYENECNEELKKDAIRTLKRNIRNAVSTLVNLMRPLQDPNVRLRAAKEIINRELGESLKKLDITTAGKPIPILSGRSGASTNNRNEKTDSSIGGQNVSNGNSDSGTSEIKEEN